jgi:TPR repeat protein
MAELMRLALPATLAVLLAACGGPADAPKAEDAAKTESVKVDPRQAAEEAKAKALADALAKQKPEFDAALATNDTAKLEELADAGNGWALHWRAQERLSSQDFSQQQGGFQDMEAAAAKGVADAQMWVGMKMAYGLDGYPLKPNSGLMMMERAARQGNAEAMLAVAQMYAQDTFMSDAKKAREWYQRAADAGSDKAKEALKNMDAKTGDGDVSEEQAEP